MLEEKDFDEYLVASRATAKYPGAFTGDAPELMYLALGLVSEFGEYLEKRESKADTATVKSELSDCFWYLYGLYAALSLPYVKSSGWGATAR